jgi:C4-dicarboxylate transporter, DctM subunit
MSPEIVGLLGILALMVLIALRVHLFAALAIVGFLGFTLIIGFKAAAANAALIPFHTLNSYSFAVLPLFLFMGEIVSESRIADYAFTSVNKWFGGIKGGTAIATIGACGLFAAICGSSTATAVAMGRMSLPEMKKQGYDDRLSIGSIAAGGEIGILIPPSVAFVLLGILTETSIGKLFISGIIPGIMQVLVYMVIIYLLVKINPKLAPHPNSIIGWKEKVSSLKLLWPIIILFLFVIGGIYFGLFSATEAGSLGAFGALVIGFAIRKLTFRGFISCIRTTVTTSAMIIAMMMGAFLFNEFLTISKIPFLAGDWIASLGLGRTSFIVIIAIAFIIIGAFFDMYAVIIITTPIFFPMAMHLGIDPLFWCVLMVMEIETGLVTPPFGLNLFVVAAATKTDLGVVYRGALPFVVGDLLRIAIILILPITATWLPSLMFQIT